MPRKESLASIADRVVPFPTAARLAGIDAGRSAKVRCPFWTEHDDGGREAALRVYDDHGYCVDMETEILTQRGWLRGDEVQRGDLALTYRDGATRWEGVQSVVRLPPATRRMLSMETKTHSSLTTEDHRWLTYYHVKGGGIRERFTTSGEGFRSSDHVPSVGGSCITVPVVPVFTDAFVELVAWFFTEGHVWKSGGVRAGISVHQSHRVNPEYCSRIREAFRACYGEPSKTIRRSHGWREAVREPKGMTEFILSVPLSRELLRVAPGKVVSQAFVNCLTRRQLRIFVETALDADGARVGTWRQLCQSDPARLEAFQAACTLLGIPARTWRRASGDWACQLHNRKGIQPSRNPGKVRWVEHDGPVWCVQMPSGTWLARRHGTVYVTGNCFAEQKYFSVTGLLSLAWEVTREDAAARVLREVGWRPASYAHLWAEASAPREPDYESLKAALHVWCDGNCPDWGTRQFSPGTADKLARCLGLLRLVRTPEDCEKWLAACKQAMSRYLS